MIYFCNYIQIEKKYAIKFFCQVRFLAKSLKVIYYSNNICKNRTENSRYNFVEFYNK